MLSLLYVYWHDECVHVYQIDIMELLLLTNFLTLNNKFMDNKLVNNIKVIIEKFINKFIENILFINKPLLLFLKNPLKHFFYINISLLIQPLCTKPL